MTSHIKDGLAGRWDLFISFVLMWRLDGKRCSIPVVPVSAGSNMVRIETEYFLALLILIMRVKYHRRDLRDLRGLCLFVSTQRCHVPCIRA
mgnify:CR=1 FL=1